ncbi:MAG: molybdenum cofactor biosynthesis protein MoaE [Candidatus Acidiferrales bacterium]
MTLMQVRVLFFGRLKDITGLASDDATLADSASLDDLFAIYARRFPALAEFRASLAASINQEYAPWLSALAPGDEVAFLPPVSGGSATVRAASRDDFFAIVRAPINSQEILAQIKSPEDGALVIFDGFVRNHSRGQQTLYLEYEAYEAMALGKIRELGAQIREKFPVDRLAIVHRLGRLEIGETSVLIAVSSPHRAQAFVACRFAIDTLKRTVPIWKKEYFASGAVWAEGEPISATRPAISASGESNS